MILFVINYSINLFVTLSITEKIILAFISTIIVLYYLFSKKDEIDIIEDTFIKYLILFFIIICILKVIEYLYMYGLNGPNSILIILSIILFSIIIINIYLFNKSL